MWQTIGQDRAVALLQGSLRGERRCHAYLFVGPRQVGKGTLAGDLARALNCTGGPAPCGQCRPCSRIAAGTCADVQVVSLASAAGSSEARRRTEIGIDQIKDVQRSASLPPFEGKYKVFIIDGAEYLSTEAGNCLLKTLEEPPPGVVLVLLTAREDLLLPTVLSRCFRVELSPLSVAAVETALAARGVDGEPARLLSRLSGGRLGWALEAATDDKVLAQRRDRLDEISALTDGSDEQRFDYAARLASVAARSREAVRDLLAMWLGWWRDLMLVKGQAAEAIANVDYKDRVQAQAGALSLGQIKDFIGSIQGAQEQVALNANPRLALEVLMLSLPRKRTTSPRTAEV